jgi:hypothetical protein
MMVWKKMYEKQYMLTVQKILQQMMGLPLNSQWVLTLLSAKNKELE